MFNNYNYRNMKKVVLLGVFLCFFTILNAQWQPTVFRPTSTFTPITSDQTILQNSLKKIEERNQKYKQKYNEAYSNYAEAIDEKKYNKAIVYLDECISINEEAKMNYYFITSTESLIEKKGDVFMLSSDTISAIDNYSTVWEKYNEKQEFKECIRIATKITTIQPTEINTYYLGISHKNAQNQSYAYNIFSTLATNSSNNECVSYCLLNMAEIKAGQDNYQEAIELLGNAIQNDNKLVSAYMMRADIYALIKKYDKAMEDCKYVLSQQISENAKIYFITLELECVYMIAKNSQDKELIKLTKEQLKKMVKVNPSIKDFLKNN